MRKTEVESKVDKALDSLRDVAMEHVSKMTPGLIERMMDGDIKVPGTVVTLFEAVMAKAMASPDSNSVHDALQLVGYYMGRIQFDPDTGEVIAPDAEV